MTTIQKPRSLAEALDEVQRWRGEEQARHAAELAETDQEIQGLKAAILNLQQQLSARERARADLVERGPSILAGEVERRYNAVFGALSQQAAAVAERSSRIAEREREREARVAETLQTGDLAAAWEEYGQFKTTVEPNLKGMPEGYRKAVLAHHEQVVAQVRAAVEQALATPVAVDADPLALDVVYAVDAPEGQPEVMMVVVPIREVAVARWQDRGDTLELHLAARVAQAVYQGLAEAGLPNARVTTGAHRDLLVVEQEVVGARADLARILAAALQRVTAAAPELAAARVSVAIRQVDVDNLLPPEGGEA